MKLSELLIPWSRLFHSITVGGKSKFFKKNLIFDIVRRNVVDITSSSIRCPSGGDFIKQIFRGLIFSYFKEITKFS